MADATATLRRCIGSSRYSIEAHEAPVEDFPAQPSQKDGLGRMCRVHWNAYTAGLARDAKARRTAEAAPATEADAIVPEPVASKQPAPRKRMPRPTAPNAAAESPVG